MENIIIDLLNIDKSSIEHLHCIKENDTLNIHLTFKKQLLLCQCGYSEPMVFKEYYVKKIKHNLVNHLKTIIHYHARRYRCSICKKSCYEPNPLSAPFQKKTFSLSTNIITKLMKPENTFSSVANELSVSPTTVINSFDQSVNDSRKQLSEVLCLDELYFSRYSSYKYCCVLVDFQTKKLVDMIESRKKYSLSKYFDSISLEERNKVNFVCIDFYQPYKQIISLKLKKAKICIDKFHVIQLLNSYLDKIRLKVMKNYTKQSNEYYLLKKFKFLLFKSKEYDINDEPKFNRKLNGYYNYHRLLTTILRIDIELKVAHSIRKSVEYFLNKPCTDLDLLSLYFDQIISEIQDSKISEFIPLINTLESWRKEILNSFVWFNGRRISNGPIESVNAKLKKIKNNGNGYANFARFRARCFLVINKDFYLKDKSSFNYIKMKKPPRGPYKKRQR